MCVLEGEVWICFVLSEIKSDIINKTLNIVTIYDLFLLEWWDSLKKDTQEWSLNMFCMQCDQVRYYYQKVE